MYAKAIVTAMIAIFVAVGMTGFAGAVTGPYTTMDYNVGFSGVGTGSMQIDTVSPVGTDQQIA